MSQSVQDLSLPPATLPAAQKAAGDAVSEIESGVPPLPADSADAASDPDGGDTFLKLATGSMAVSYYISTAMHVAAYVVAALVFAYIGHVLQEDTAITPLRASLDDFDRSDKQPSFEVIPALDLGAADGESNMERISNNLKVVENGLVSTLANDSMFSLLQNNELEDPGAGSFLFNVPESGLAVTKGSFTVWTEPENPRANQSYYIIIEVRLKNDTRVYRINDLSGYVVGSDRYRQKIPFDTEAPTASFFTDENKQMRQISGTERIKIRNNKVQLAIRIPGAARLVKDTIEIRSRRLREKQELELVFGAQ